MRLGRAKRVLKAQQRLVLEGAPWIENLGTIVVGDDAIIVSKPVQSHFVTGPGGTIVIGARSSIGPGAAFAAHERIVVGEDAKVGAFVVVMDTDFHTAADIDASSATSPVKIGARAVIDDHVTILKGASIGEGAHVGAGSVVSGTVPAGAFVRGVPASVVVVDAPGKGSSSISPDRVPEVVMATVERTFAVTSAQPNQGPKDIPGWDSLGALRLLVALEEACGISLPEDSLRDVASIEELVDVVRRGFVSP
ncbi:Maltose O-acetyltransferase [Labilithrix luteola]|uniref:Maltose O-acetyltransferase n=1 Tax=Labilithrix luteola TaxID=1391654 RepID=A0A0K1Q293_9BACT|nr:Maltose O-acetyltransferase [Labilithrix luteola]